MTRIRRALRRHNTGRRLTSAVALACYLLTALGVPLPAAPVRRSAVPYPCQERACGCRSPEECWSGCCCMSVEERWEWARRHHVEPPDYAERPSDSGTPVGARKKAHHSCCSQHAEDGSEPCCEDSTHDDSEPPATEDSTQPPEAKKPTRGKSIRWAFGIAALKCKGLSTLWVTNGVVCLTIVPDCRPIPSTPEWLASFDEAPSAATLAPLDPPPRPSFA